MCIRFFIGILLAEGLKIALVCSYLRVPQTAGQVKNLIFLKKINFFPYMPINFVMQLGRVPILIHFETCGNGPEV